MKRKISRAKAFVPQLILHLAQNDKFSCAFTSLPQSYQDQPYNLAAKLLARAKISAKIVFNKQHNTFTILRTQPPATN